MIHVWPFVAFVWFEAVMKIKFTHLRCFSRRQKLVHALSFSRKHWHRGPLLVAMESATARLVLGALPSPYETTRLDGGGKDSLNQTAEITG